MRARPGTRFSVVVAVCCVVLIPWTVFLAMTLPRQYIASHWRAAWVGYDIALLVGLALSAWRAYRRRPSFASTATVTATLLLVDAWFDVTTASGHDDRAASLASALLAELPLGVLLIVAARRAHREQLPVPAPDPPSTSDQPSTSDPPATPGPASTSDSPE